MYCPKCGDLLQLVIGELACVRGGIGLSKYLERNLTECYITDRSTPAR